MFLDIIFLFIFEENDDISVSGMYGFVSKSQVDAINYLKLNLAPAIIRITKFLNEYNTGATLFKK